MSRADWGRIAVIGSANADLVLDVAHRPAAGETVLGSDMVTTSGGKGANQAVAAARMEADVVFIGCVGADAHGQMLRTSLANAGVDITSLRSVDRPTGAALIVVTPDGENSIIVSPGANRSVTPELLADVEEQWAAAKVLVVQLEVPVDSVEFAARRATETGARFLLNAAPMGELSDELLGACDPLVVNESEAALLVGNAAGADGAEALARKLLQRGPRSVVVTLGAEGAIVGDGRSVTRIAAAAVQALDTTGAGDAFVGALAAELSAGRDLAQSARVAGAYAGLTVTRRGAQASYPTREESARLGAAVNRSP